MAATATATGGAPKLSYTSSSNRRGLNPTKKLIGSTKFLIQNLNQSSAWSVQRPFPAQASNKPKIEEQDSGIDDDVVASSNTQVSSWICSLRVVAFMSKLCETTQFGNG